MRIEFHWASTKNWVRLNKESSSLKHVKELVNKRMDDLNPNAWPAYVKRVMQFHREMSSPEQLSKDFEVLERDNLELHNEFLRKLIQ